MFSQAGLGLYLLVSGLIALLLIGMILRLLPRPKQWLESALPASLFESYPGVSSHDAILFVGAGGRIEYINPIAREWFGLAEGELADLERLSRRVRPSEEFLQLCAQEGQKRFSINGRLADAVSYRLPGPAPVMLVTLRTLELWSAEQGEAPAGSSALLSLMAELSRAIHAQLSLEATLRTVFQSVRRLIAADLMEILLEDPSSPSSTIYRYEESGGTARAVRTSHSQFSAFAPLLKSERKPILLADQSFFEPQTLFPTFKAYLGVPLIVQDEYIGSLEIAQVQSGGLREQDAELVKWIADHAAVALRNAQRFEAERTRAEELDGLARIAQAATAIQEPQELFERLTGITSKLLPNIEILGFLLYDEAERRLEAKSPFQGLPSSVIPVYRTSIPPDSPAEKYLRNPSPLFLDNAASDPIIQDLGLQGIAQMASLRETIFQPLITGGRFIGYLQASNHRLGPAPFLPDEKRLLEIISAQVAILIDNALLIQQARQRHQRSEALRRIASLVASSATLDEVLQYSVHELAQLLRADFAAIYLIDPHTYQLRAHLGSVWGVPQEIAPKLAVLDTDLRTLKRATVSGSQRAFHFDQLSSDERVSPVYQSIIQSLGVESALLVPLLARDKSVGEIMFGSRTPGFFSPSDLQTLSTAAGLLAAAVEGAALRNQTDDTLRRRLDRLFSVAHVGRELNALLPPARLLEILYEQSLSLTRADCGALLIFDPDSPDEPRLTSHLGCPVPDILSPLAQHALAEGIPKRIADLGEEGDASHPGVRSALIVPILHHGQALGVIELHAQQPDVFDDIALESVHLLALQAAIALHNAYRFRQQAELAEQARQRAASLSLLAEVASPSTYQHPVEQALLAIASAIQRATPFQIVLISIYEPDTDLLQRVAGMGMPAETLQELLSRKQPLKSLKTLLCPEFKIGRAYFIPSEHLPVIPADVHTVVLSAEQEEAESGNAWKPEDLLLFLLEDPQGAPLGLLSVDRPRNNLRPDRLTLEILEIFAAQAELVILQHRQRQELLNRIESLTAGLQRQQRLLAVTQSDLPTLLHKDLDQTIAIHDLDRRVHRLRAGLAIAETVSAQIDAPSVMLALGREMITRLGMAVALLAEEAPDGPRLTQILGSVPKGTNPEALFGQRNPLRTAMQTGQAIVIPNLDENEEWRDAALLVSLRARSVIGLPIQIGDRVVAGVLATSPEPLAGLTEEDRQIYDQLARQTGIVLQNISLLAETRRRLQEVNLLLDFSRQLSGLDLGNIVHALLDSARRVITAAHAGFVLLWDRQALRLIPRAVAGYADNQEMLKLTFAAGEALPGVAFALGRPHRVDEVNLARDYPLDTEALLHYRQVTGGRVPVSSLAIPIVAGEQSLGVLVLDNFNTVGAFKAEDEALLVSLAQQAALSLENVRLVQAMQERASQLQALTDVATTITARLQRRELIDTLLDQLLSILPYNTATLWLREEDELIVYAARGFPNSQELIGVRVQIADSNLFQQMIRAGRPITIRNTRQDPRFPVVEPMRLSWMGIPLITKGEVIGLVALEKEQPNFYTDEHIQIATTFAGQAAIALENANLFEESLRRAAELDERSQRLALLNRFSSALSGLLDTDRILELCAQELMDGFAATRVSVLTVERGQILWKLSLPRARRPFIKPIPRVPLLDRLHESQGVYASDDVQSDHDLHPLLDWLGLDTRSLMILPLGISQAWAFILLHSNQPARFGVTEVELARTIGNQASIALENARLYQSTVQTAERLAILNQVSSEINASLDPEEIYVFIHKAIQRLMPVDGFLLALRDKEQGDLEGVYRVDGARRLPNERLTMTSKMREQVIGQGTPMLISSKDQAKELNVAFSERGIPSSVLAVPMAIGGEIAGLLAILSYQPNVYTQEDLQILSTLANQAIVALQNARLFAETQRLAAELEQRVIERTAQLQREQQNTETLLRILTEVSSSLDLDRALNRTLALLNDAIGAEQGTIMLLHADDNMLHYRAGYGYLTYRAFEESRAVTLRVGEGLAGWVVQHRQAVLVEDLHQDPRWVRPIGGSREHRSCVVAPLMVGEDVIGVLMAFHRKVGFFSPEVLNLMQAIAAQVAVAINNAHLYELIRDQAERLGTMLRKEQEEASRSQAILEAVADGVLVTDADNNVTFLNKSAERILHLSAEQVLDKSLEDFIGLFGRAAATWMQTIRRWSENPASYRPGDTYAEQIELEDKRIVQVHLAPVMLQNDFLGTVSIFRDITHEVEVDRLKSEFVATVSHELRTPMTSIRGYADILLMGAAGPLNENQTHFLQIIKNNTERLNILVNDLLDISRIEAGRVALSPQPLDVRKIAEDVLADILRRSQEDNKPMAISLNAPHELPRIFGDAERVRQILSNLVDNAYNYTPAEGQIRVRIHVNQDNEVQVDVSDSGVGVPIEEQNRIFERFYRGEHPFVLATPGTGLGLPIVKQLVEMHNGRIWMESKGIPGEGSTFSFTLPIYQEPTKRGKNGKDSHR